jgi:hypothetical protein
VEGESLRLIYYREEAERGFMISRKPETEFINKRGTRIDLITCKPGES